MLAFLYFNVLLNILLSINHENGYFSVLYNIRTGRSHYSILYSDNFMVSEHVLVLVTSCEE